MRKFLIIAVAAIIIGGGTWPVFAETTSGPSHKAFNDHINGKLDKYLDHTHEYTDNDTHKDEKSAEDTKAGVKADAPNLIRLSKDTTIGVEGGKDLVNTNAKEGWFVFGKLTWTGTLFDFSKK